MESVRVVRQSEVHADPTKCTMVDYERLLFMVFPGDRQLPVSPVGIELGLYSGITETFDEIFHVRNGVRIQDGDFVQLSVIDAESRSSIFRRRDYYWGGPIALGSLNGFCGKHLGDVLLDQLMKLWTGTIWFLGDWT